MTPTPPHLDKKREYLMKEKRYFNCKKNNYTVYNSPKKRKIAIILECFIENNNR